MGNLELILEKHTERIHHGLEVLPTLRHGVPEGLGNKRWTGELILATYEQALTGEIPENGLEYKTGNSGGGFDVLGWKRHEGVAKVDEYSVDLSISLNKRHEGRKIEIPLPIYGGGMSFGSISLNFMIARARAARKLKTYTSTGEGGYPDQIVPYRDHVITQVATGMFGVREETIQYAPIVEFKYAQGAKPGLGGHLLADKVTSEVAKMRESSMFTSLYSPFPFHSVYSVEDHKKHVDWIKTVNPRALVSVKVSTPTDVDMVAIGSYDAEAVAVASTHSGNCERGRGCQVGITTTDPELSRLIEPEWGETRIVNLFSAWSKRLRSILAGFGLESVRDLRGRKDLLVRYK